MAVSTIIAIIALVIILIAIVVTVILGFVLKHWKCDDGVCKMVLAGSYRNKKDCEHKCKNKDKSTNIAAEEPEPEPKSEPKSEPKPSSDNTYSCLYDPSADVARCLPTWRKGDYEASCGNKTWKTKEECENSGDCIRMDYDEHRGCVVDKIDGQYACKAQCESEGPELIYGPSYEGTYYYPYPFWPWRRHRRRRRIRIPWTPIRPAKRIPLVPIRPARRVPLTPIRPAMAPIRPAMAPIQPAMGGGMASIGPAMGGGMASVGGGMASMGGGGGGGMASMGGGGGGMASI